jgi:hypothetical protein
MAVSGLVAGSCQPPSRGRGRRLLPPPLVALALLCLAGPGGWLAAPSPAQAQLCVRTPSCGFDLCKAPASAVPASYWGPELQAFDTGQLPTERDVTAFNEFLQLYSANPYFFAIDIRNGWAFTAMTWGVKIWDVRNGGSPIFWSYLDFTHFPVFNPSEQKTPLQDISLPPNVDTLGAVVGLGDVGLSIIDFTDKTHPVLLYQNAPGDGLSLHTATLPPTAPPQAQTHYAFMASNGAALPPGILIYDMDAAVGLSACLDTTPGDTCPGVYVGKITTNAAPVFLAGVDQFLAESYVSNSGVDIWDVTNPTSPVRKLTAVTDFGVHGIAMWKDAASGHYVLAARAVPNFASAPGAQYQLEILDVNCITSTCTDPPPVLSTYVDTSDSSPTANYLLTLSYSGATPFLYLGSDQTCGTPSAQREWLLDVSKPAAPHDITPPSGTSGGYWGWYYMSNNATGFNYVMPRRGKFWGQYFYRAAESIFDVHKRVVATAPTAAFSWNPQVVYPGTPVAFIDQSANFPTSWTWSFAPEGAPQMSVQPSPMDFGEVELAARRMSVESSKDP